MKRFFSKFGLWILGAIAVATVVLCILTSIGNSTGFLRNVGGIITSPFRSAGSSLSNWVQQRNARFETVAELQAENEALRQENAQLEQALRDAQDDRAENESLRQALGIRQQHSDYSLELAKITDRSSSNWTSTLTLNIGTASGLTAGNCAIDSYGNLVGVVTEVGKNWSVVTTILDTSSQIGSMIFRTGDVAVSCGDLSLMSEGLLKLKYLSRDAALINGDLVMTTGLGGYYPSSLPIGAVVDLGTDETGVDQYATLSPKANVNHLTEVFVVTSFDVVE